MPGPRLPLPALANASRSSFVRSTRNQFFGNVTA